MPTPKRLGWSGGKHGAQLAGSGVRRGAKLAGPGVRRDVQCGGARRHSKSRYSAENQGKPKGVTGRWPRPSLYGRHEPMGGLTTYDITVFVTLVLLLALVLVLLLR